MEKNTLTLLEFDKILDLISTRTKSSGSAGAVREIRPLESRAEMEHRQRLIREIMRMCNEGKRLRINPFSDISPLLTKVRPEGAVLEAKELSAFLPLLEISAEIPAQIADAGDFPFINELASALTGFPIYKET